MLLGDKVWLTSLFQFIQKVLDEVRSGSVLASKVLNWENNFFMDLALCTGALSLKMEKALREAVATKLEAHYCLKQ